MLLSTTKKWQTLRSCLDSLNISTEKYTRNYQKPQRNFLSACSIDMSSWKKKMCNCTASIYCKSAQACAEMTKIFVAIPVAQAQRSYSMLVLSHGHAVDLSSEVLC